MSDYVYDRKYFDYEFDPEYVYILLWRYDFELSDIIIYLLNYKHCEDIGKDPGSSDYYDEFENKYHKDEHFNLRFDKNVISILLYQEKIVGEKHTEFIDRRIFQNLVKKIDKKIYEKKYFFIRDNNIFGEIIEYNTQALNLDKKFKTFCEKIKSIIDDDSFDPIKRLEILQMLFQNKLTLNTFEETFNLLPGIGSEFIKAQKDFDKLKYKTKV